jgi:hypothetical protein
MARVGPQRHEKQTTLPTPRWHHLKGLNRTDKKLTNLMGKLCCAREHSVQFFMQFFYTDKLHSLT